MGSFIGHILPGTLFLLVGVWHIWGSVVRYVSNPKTFRVHVWNPVPGFNGRLKHLELYVISIGAFIDLCVELLLATHLRFFVDGSLNTTYFNNFEHSGMLLMFLIYGVVALFSEKTRYLPLPVSALCLIAATAFCADPRCSRRICSILWLCSFKICANSEEFETNTSSVRRGMKYQPTQCSMGISSVTAKRR